jgi:hypothetical protein
MVFGERERRLEELGFRVAVDFLRGARFVVDGEVGMDRRFNDQALRVAGAFKSELFKVEHVLFITSAS